MIIIADSGSTKTTWACVNLGVEEPFTTAPITSLGINPIRDDEDTITKAIERGRESLYRQSQIAQQSVPPFLCEKTYKEHLNPKEQFNPATISAVHFYGAGCIPPYSTTVKRLLEKAYPNAKISVESDMLGAALALCGHNEGIACILGTGSNSCLFDGEKIVAQTPALGFILGDEGSGASLGKRLVGDTLKKQLPDSLREAFFDEMQLSQSDIINKVYRQAQPNMFLASLVPFLDRHRHHPALHNMIVEEFRAFLRRNILNYQRPDLPIHFVGGITFSFSEELHEAVEAEHLKMGKLLARPIKGMIDYHKT